MEQASTFRLSEAAVRLPSLTGYTNSGLDVNGRRCGRQYRLNEKEKEKRNVTAEAAQPRHSRIADDTQE